MESLRIVPSSGLRALGVTLFGERPAGFALVRVGLGAVLLTAAALKGYQLATEPVAGGSVLRSRAFLVALVEFELFFGLWLVWGAYPWLTWRLAIGCFSVFACAALYQAFSGWSSCGCFGKLKANPWFTAGFDVLAVAALMAWRPGEKARRTSRAEWRRLAGAVGLTVLLGLPGGYFMARYTPAALAHDGSLAGSSHFVVLEPETWIDKPFPLLKYIDISEQLARGDWLVMLYHHDCPSCLREIPRYERLAASRPTALVEMPPYAPSGLGPVAASSPCVRGRVADVREWFVETPAELMLKDGIVTAASVNAEH